MAKKEIDCEKECPKSTFLPKGLSPKNWATIIGIILLGGSGTFGGFSAFAIVDAKQVDNTVNRAIDKHEEKHTELCEKIKLNTNKLNAIEKNVNKLQENQYKETARREARRLTVDIKNRDDRHREYNRLVDLNLWRLMHDMEPCMDIGCTR